MNTSAPIIVKRVNKGRHKSHSSAWKVALADFAVAMMAFFLVMWLMGSTTKEQKEAISDYFNDPVIKVTTANTGTSDSLIDLGGGMSGVVRPTAEMDGKEHKPILIDEEQLEDLVDEKDEQRLEQLKDRLDALVDSNDTLSKYKDQLVIEKTPDGLRIQIIDKENRASFDSGRAKLKLHTAKVIVELAKVIAMVPNKISVTGHTDSTRFSQNMGYSNWELSTDRANAARRALLSGGLPPMQIAKVEGFADSVPYDKDDEKNPINRRIAIIVLYNRKAERMQHQAESELLKQQLNLK